MSVRSGDHCSAHKVFFINVHSIHIALRCSDLLQCINRADIVLPDGSGLKIAGKICGNPVVENLNGTDFTPKVLTMAQEEGFTVYLVGAREETLHACRKWLAANYPLLQIVGHHHGYFTVEQEHELIIDVNSKKPNIVLVALGTPRQELWISKHAPTLKAGICLAVGGLFDFLSGEQPRAPIWLRRIGMEWIFRFLYDPRTKWDRVIIEIPTFLILVLAIRFMPKSLRRLIPLKGITA